MGEDSTNDRQLVIILHAVRGMQTYTAIGHRVQSRHDPLIGQVYDRHTLQDDAPYEYVRLRIDGTQFHADATFRYHLGPVIEFLPKTENHSGLQIADLVARACAEKVLRPLSMPPRWALVQPKLYDGVKGQPEKYGLKTFPIHAAVAVCTGTANGDAFAPPSTD